MRRGILGWGVLWLGGLCGCSSSESAGRGEGTNGGDGGEASGERGTADDDSTDVDNGGTDGSEACTVGDETCPCYPNETCNGSLTCFSGLCVDAGGGGGGAGGAQGDAGGAQGGAGNSGDLVGPSGAGGSASSGAGSAGSMSSGGGAAVVGTGGSGAVSTGGGAGTGGADTNASGGDDGYAVGARGYVTSGTWRGYAWVMMDSPEGDGSTVTPTSFDSVEAGDQLCVSGVVGFDPEFGIGSSVWLGINLAQPEGAPAGERYSWLRSGGGIEYEVQNNAGSPLIMIIMGTLGYPDEAWCAVLEESSGSVGWREFQKWCWDDPERSYSDDGYRPLEAIAFIVIGAEDTTVPFDFCIVSIGVDD